MMKKNFLGKFMVLAAMIYAGFTLSSCDEKDNPSGNNWTALKVTNKTETGATVTANSASEVNSLIASLSKDIKAAVTDGKDYTITIDVPSLKVTETNHTISLPAPNSGEDGGTLILYIKNSFSTDGTPLLVKSNEASEDDWAYGYSDSKAEILLPAGISDIDLEINMPHSTVTIDSKGNAIIDELVAVTGNETLIIENGITVNWLNIYKGGKGVLKKGGKVLGALINEGDYHDIYFDGLLIEMVENEIPEGFDDLSWDEKKEYFIYLNKAKVKKGEENGYSTLWIEAGYGEEPKKVAEVEVTIEDGANVIINGDSWANYYPIVNFTGEGDNARIIAWGNKEDDKFTIGNGSFLRPINKLTNVTVDFSTCFAWALDEELGYIRKEVETEFIYGPLYLPHSSESCTFKAPGFEFNVPDGYSSTSASFKDCTFGYANIKTDNDEDLQLCLKVNFPSETKARTAFDLSFDTCDFSKVFQFQVNYWGYFKKYEGFITLDNTTMDKKAVTKDTKMIKYVNNAADGEQDPPVYHSTTFFVIDGTTYEPIEKDGIWKLIPVDD